MSVKMLEETEEFTVGGRCVLLLISGGPAVRLEF